MEFLARKAFGLAERVFNVTIYRKLPRGIDPFHDLQALIPRWHPSVIFDVGANIGQSAEIYAKRFPSATIFSFEPAAETFKQLKQNVSVFSNVRCMKLAFASQVGTGTLAHGTHSNMTRIISNQSRADLVLADNCETIDQTTIDDFCKQQKMHKIDYLKVDTEGADLEVLRGAEQMIQNAMIEVIEVEAGIGLDNELHVPCQNFRDYLESKGYSVFGFYEQVNEWKRQLSHLRRTNVVFISKSLEL